MKIAILGTRGIPNNYGGFEQFAEYLSVDLIDKGHEVSVYNSHNHIFKKNTYKGVRIIHCYDPEYLIGTIGQFIYDFNCILDCRKKNFDIILQLGYTSSSIWNWLIPNKSILITNMDGIEWKRSKFSNAVQKFLKYAEYIAIKNSNYLVSDSLGIKEYLYDTYQAKSIYIPYGTEVMKSPSIHILNKYNLISYKYDIVIARIEPENNIEMIIKGFLNSNMNRYLVIVGSLKTNFAKYLVRNYKTEKIKYLDFISGSQNLNTLRYFSNIYFHGHSVGGTNPSLLEAMSSNSLICAHKNIFNESILENDGLYFKNTKDITDLINKIQKKNYLELLKNNVIKTKKYYSWDKICNKYELFFKEIHNKL